MMNDQKAARTSTDERLKTTEKRRTEKAARDKKFQEALDKLILVGDETKKQKAADDKKPGTQAILDALK
jgi:carbamoylphosphate synthase large subunit